MMTTKTKSFADCQKSSFSMSYVSRYLSSFLLRCCLRLIFLTTTVTVVISSVYGLQRINNPHHDLSRLNLPLGTDRLLSSSTSSPSSSNAPFAKDYFGTLIGRLETHHHDVSGIVYAVDESTVFVRSFTYDGTGPDAYFWAGSTSKPDTTGFIIPDEKGSTKPLGAYKSKDIVLRLPEGRTFKDIKWISIWCRKFTANFADILIPSNLLIPTPVEISPLKPLAHGVRSGPITIVDAQTLLVPGFHYDGEGPAAHFWMTRGPSQSNRGIRLLNENGSSKPLTKFSGETVLVSLPEDKTIWDFDWFGVWCESAQVDFGSARIPQNVKVPPSPRMLGVKPEGKLNCEVLYDDLGFELRWVMDGDDIVMQLVGRVEPGEYMAFGLGKDDTKSDMVNSDAIIAWIDSKTRKGHAVDYFLGSKEQCVGSRGVCPDVKVSKSASDSITLLHSSLVNGFSMITFKRPQLGVDDHYDQHVYSDGQQSVNWAIGHLNNRSEPSYHRLHSIGNLFIDFARTPKWNCPSPDAPPTTESIVTTTAPTTTSVVTPPPAGLFGVNIAPPPVTPPRPLNTASLTISSSSNTNVWEIPPIICPSDRTFRAQIGPTGGRKGFQSITGKVGWGIAWYINGLLIPELVVERGKTYTFIVEGGNDQTHSSRRHPLYITDNSEGGFEFRTDEEKATQRIYAGAALRSDGQVVPTSEGRLCEWKMTDMSTSPDSFPDFFSFQRSLKLQCAPGKAAIIRWTPDSNTPDIVYYQCWTHRLLGWKIRVVDSCENIAAASVLRIRHTNPNKKNNHTINPTQKMNRSSHPVPAGSIMNTVTAGSSTTSSIPPSTTPPVPTAAALVSPHNNNHHSHKHHRSPPPQPFQSSKMLPRPVHPPPPPPPPSMDEHEIVHHNSKKKHKKSQKKSPPKYSLPLSAMRSSRVHFNIQPQIETWLYHPSASSADFFSGTYEPHLPSAVSQPMPSPPVMTFEPFFLPSYPLPPIEESERPPVFIRQKLPPPIPLPRGQPLPPGPTALNKMVTMSAQQATSPSESEKNNNRLQLQGGFLPMLINSKPKSSIDRNKSVWWKEHDLLMKNNNNLTKITFTTPVRNQKESLTSFSLPINPLDESVGHVSDSLTTESVKYNISRYGYPFMESNRILPKSASVTLSPSSPTSTLKVKHSTITKMKNSPPMPYYRPTDSHKSSTSSSSESKDPDHMVAMERDSKASSSVMRPTHHTDNNDDSNNNNNKNHGNNKDSSTLSPTLFSSHVSSLSAVGGSSPWSPTTFTPGYEVVKLSDLNNSTNHRSITSFVTTKPESFGVDIGGAIIEVIDSVTLPPSTTSTLTTMSSTTPPPTTTTTSSSPTTTDNLKNHQGYATSTTKKSPKEDKQSLSYSTNSTGVSYNPIYFDESNNSVNVSSTDHTILNHILSLIAVGESPPEVKVFKKKSSANDNMEGAYSTHVEVHQRIPKN